MNNPKPDESAPKLQLESQFGGSGPPKPPTALGQIEPNSEELHSWPMPTQSYLQFDSLAETTDATQSKAIEDLLIGLHNQRANLSFLLLGTKADSAFNIGISVPNEDWGIPKSAEDEDSNLLGLLRSVCGSEAQLDLHYRSEESIKSSISSVTRHCGIVCSTYPYTLTDLQSLAINQLSKDFNGRRFGLLVLAIPIPKPKVIKEEHMVFDMLQGLEPTEQDNQRNASFIRKQTQYLKALQLGEDIGMWLTEVLLFATDRKTLLQIESKIIPDKGALDVPSTLTFVRPKGLPRHINDLGLIRNKRSDFVANDLLDYKYLTPLTSRDLSKWIHLPCASATNQ